MINSVNSVQFVTLVCGSVDRGRDGAVVPAAREAEAAADGPGKAQTSAVWLRAPEEQRLAGGKTPAVSLQNGGRVCVCVFVCVRVGGHISFR